MEVKTMKAMVASSYGGPEVFQLRHVPISHPEKDEVLVKVHVASLTTADTMMRVGKPYIGRLFTGIRKPKHPIPGTGFSGVVVAVGENVTRFVEGDEVFGETTLGFSTHAEYVLLPENGVIQHKPENLPHEEAASYGDGVLTAYNFLIEIANLTPGQRVLINGAAGAVGSAGLQIAKHFGAHVTAVASAHNHGKLTQLGADACIDYQTQDFTESNQLFDVVFDAVGKSSYAKCKSILTPNGIYLSTVLKASILWDSFITALTQSTKRAAFAATGLRKDHELNEMLSEVIKIQQKGALHLPIDRQYPLEKLAEAHGYLSTGKKKGNVILRVES
ncbi:NAD(P)-dependent alcohol dehydrogenase [Phaeocystidibacter marisrubri]|nr:NAD(P)-dependent alcohol dehydrogenase [Phaeocystidibacter marisrubri]